MDRNEFISLIGTKTLFDYNSPSFEKQIWSMENFNYDKENDIITHNRLDLIMDVIIKWAENPRYGDKSEATHG